LSTIRESRSSIPRGSAAKPRLKRGHQARKGRLGCVQSFLLSNQQLRRWKEPVLKGDWRIGRPCSRLVRPAASHPRQGLGPFASSPSLERLSVSNKPRGFGVAARQAQAICWPARGNVRVDPQPIAPAGSTVLRMFFLRPNLGDTGACGFGAQACPSGAQRPGPRKQGEFWIWPKAINVTR